MTTDCLNSIKANTPPDSYEIILIDNGSNPPFPNPGWKNLTYLRNESNTGFPAAVNQGIYAATGDIITLLNDDTICTQGWQDRLLFHLDTYSIVGPLTNYCAGLQRVTIPVYQDEQELNKQATKWSADHDKQSIPANWVIGFCMAFRKSLWEEIGPFDESLWPCSGEELIFCLEARKRGHRVGIARDVYVHHFGSVTLNDLEKSGQINYLDICTRNDKHIAELYGKDWINQLIERSE